MTFLDIVKEHYDNGDIILDGSDFEDNEFDVYPESEDLDPEYAEAR